MSNVSQKPAQFIEYAPDSLTLCIDNPDGGLPIEVYVESRKKADLDAGLAELSMVTGKPVDYWYITFNE